MQTMGNKQENPEVPVENGEKYDLVLLKSSGMEFMKINLSITRELTSMNQGEKLEGFHRRKSWKNIFFIYIFLCIKSVTAEEKCR